MQTSRGFFRWARIRRYWATLAVVATTGLVVWSLVAYRASDEAKAAVASDGRVRVDYADGVWSFSPTGDATGRAALVFFPGALVDPVAYAPLLRAVAVAGFPAYMIELPRRGAMGGAEDPEVISRLERLLSGPRSPARWIVAGHSRGAVVACNVVASRPAGLVGAVLIGTTHPRDVDLSASPIALAKIGGTRDGIARREDSEANAAKLPAATRWLWIEGGNHSQFGWYGFQPFDRTSTIPAQAQRRAMIDAVIEALDLRATTP